MPLPIVRQKATGQAIARAIPAESLYDSECLQVGVVAKQVTWFSNTQGQADASGIIVSKTDGDTNLTQPQQLPDGFKFDLHYITVKAYSNTYASEMTRQDYQGLVRGSWFEAQISKITVAKCLGVSVPFGVALEIDGTTAAGAGAFRTGTAHRSNALVCKMGKSHPTINGKEQFVAGWKWGQGDNFTFTPDCAIRMMCEYWGINYKPL